MAKTIELYNLDKYSAYLPSPKVDMIEGDADEIILSADGRETPASDGFPGSLSINASGGVYTDTGSRATCELSYMFTILVNSTGPEEFLSFDKRDYRSAVIDVIIQSGNNFTTKTLTVIHNNSVVTIHESVNVRAPISATWSEEHTGAIIGNNVSLYVDGLASNSIVSCISRYTLT